MKKILKVVALAIIVILPVIVLASHYEENITLPPAGIKKTASKKYTKGAFKLTYKVDSIFDDSYQRYATFVLTKNTLLGSKNVYYEFGKTEPKTQTTKSFGNQSAGTYQFGVGARGNAFNDSGSDEVYSGFIGKLYTDSN